MRKDLTRRIIQSNEKIIVLGSKSTKVLTVAVVVYHQLTVCMSCSPRGTTSEALPAVRGTSAAQQ